MNEIMSIAEIKDRFESEWVLLDNPQTGRGLEVIGGRVLWHNRCDWIYGELGHIGVLGYDPAIVPDRMQLITGSGLEFVPRIVMNEIQALGQKLRDFPIRGSSLSTLLLQPFIFLLSTLARLDSRPLSLCVSFLVSLKLLLCHSERSEGSQLDFP